MSDPVLEQLEAIIQRDVNNRGLARIPEDNLIARCRGDFATACCSLAEAKAGKAAIATGFWIPAANAAETDGPLGALQLGRVLAALGWTVAIYSESFCAAGLRLAASLTVGVGVPIHDLAADAPLPAGLTHLIAIERVGPSHLHDDIPPANRDQYHTMRGLIITDKMQPAHRWFERNDDVITIGIGDGGNEIGMGKVPWEVIARNVPNGGLTACRIATDYNIVCGISNWGAYGLAAGVWHLSGRSFDPELFNVEAERQLWEEVLRRAVLVDGVTGRRELTVDGLSWEEYARPLQQIADVLKSKA
jgi:hypothetical protein